MNEETPRGEDTLNRTRRLSMALRNPKKKCAHLVQIQEVRPSAEGCEDCLRLGDSWIHLRLCMTCGYVGCCNDSKNKHAARHSHAANHPIVRSFEPGESWMWCYVDSIFLFQP